MPIVIPKFCRKFIAGHRGTKVVPLHPVVQGIRPIGNDMIISRDDLPQRITKHADPERIHLELAAQLIRNGHL